MKIAPRQTRQNGGKMKRRKRKQKQGCDLAKAIDSIERAVRAAVKTYRAIEPIIKAILKNGRKVK
jgi:Flp pilus assembly protein TadB